MGVTSLRFKKRIFAILSKIDQNGKNPLKFSKNTQGRFLFPVANYQLGLVPEGISRYLKVIVASNFKIT